MRRLHTELKNARIDLERQSLEASSTAQAVSFITIVQKSEMKIKVWAPLVDLFVRSQGTLHRERYHFPEDWLQVDVVSSEWDALNEILTRKSKQVRDQIGIEVSLSIFNVSLFAQQHHHRGSHRGRESLEPHIDMEL